MGQVITDYLEGGMIEIGDEEDGLRKKRGRHGRRDMGIE